MTQVGDQFGYISQQLEPRVQTGWGVIEKILPGGQALVRWPRDPNPQFNLTQVTLAHGDVRRASKLPD